MLVPLLAMTLAMTSPLDTPDSAGRTPLLLAVEANDLPEATRLIAAGANLNAQAANKDTPWLQAGALGRTQMLSAMLDKGGVDYTVRNRYGGNALIPACERGHVATVKLLLERSEIDVDHVNNLGWTCLLEAVILGDGGPAHQEIVALALEHGADVNLADKDGVTPLAHARQRGQTAICRPTRKGRWAVAARPFPRPISAEPKRVSLAISAF
jgi:ankyrin repeat protein